MRRLAYDKTTGELCLFCEYEDREAVKTLKDYKWDSFMKCWRFPFSIRKVQQIERLFQQSVEVASIVYKLVDEEANKIRELAELKKKKDIEVTDYQFPKTSPFPHQKVDFRWILEMFEWKGGCLVGNEMGTGKSATALWVGDYLMKRGEIQRMMIFCPKSVKYNWENEVEKHTTLQAVVVEGTKEKRLKKLNRFAQIYILNYEAGVIFEEQVKELVKNQLLVVDEFQHAKNERTQFCKLLKRLEPKYKLLMSGTPYHNKPEDIYFPSNYVGKFWRSWWAFQDRYLVLGGYGGYEVVGYRNKEELKELIDRIMVRRLITDCVNLPPKLYEDRYLEMNGRQKEAYEKMRKEMILAWQDVSDDELQYRSREVNAQLIRLSQIADGYLSDGFRQEWIEENVKEKELDEFLEEMIEVQGKKVVVWSSFVYPVAELWQKYNKKYGAVAVWGKTGAQDRQRYIDRFNTDPNCRLYIGQIETGGIGVNLIGGTVQVFWRLSWNPSNNEQAEARLWRIGQEHPVNVIRFLVKDSIDERMIRLVKKKMLIVKDMSGDIPKLDKATLMDLLR